MALGVGVRALLAAAALALVLCGGAAAVPRASRYLFISTPRLSRISYVKVERDGATAPQPRLLIDQLGTPQGLAMDQPRNQLLVADPALKQVLAFTVRANSSGLTASQKRVIVPDVEVRWIALDSQGDMFMTDEANSQILKVSYASIIDGNAVPTVLYDAGNPQVSSPGGIATDNFHLYWTNKKEGQQAGSVIEAPVVAPTTALQTTVLATLSKVSPKAYGVCLARQHLYYTDPEQKLYGLKRKSDDPVTQLSSSLTQPRGCIFDGDSTIFVADRGAGAVYSFAAEDILEPVTLVKDFSVEDAFGLAMSEMVEAQEDSGFLGLGLVQEKAGAAHPGLLCGVVTTLALHSLAVWGVGAA